MKTNVESRNTLAPRAAFKIAFSKVLYHNAQLSGVSSVSTLDIFCPGLNQMGRYGEVELVVRKCRSSGGKTKGRKKEKHLK